MVNEEDSTTANNKNGLLRFREKVGKCIKQNTHDGATCIDQPVGKPSDVRPFGAADEAAGVDALSCAGAGARLMLLVVLSRLGDADGACGGAGCRVTKKHKLEC